MFSDLDIKSGKATCKIQLAIREQILKKEYLDFSVLTGILQNIVNTIFNYDENDAIDDGNKGYIIG